MTIYTVYFTPSTGTVTIFCLSHLFDCQFKVPVPILFGTDFA